MKVGALYTVYIGNETRNRCAHMLNMHRTDIFHTDFQSHDRSTVRYRDAAFLSKCQLTLMAFYGATKLGIVWYLILYDITQKTQKFKLPYFSTHLTTK